MCHRIFLVAAIVGVSVACFGVNCRSAHAQDAQAEAKAKAARREAAQDSARSNTEVAEPTQVGSQPRSDSTPAQDAEKLKRRAGEQVGDNPRGRTLILGMHVKEAGDGGVEISEVGTATPAQQAGILKGDKIISFQNFKANTYRKWIDGITRLATTAPDGSKLIVVVSRDGNPVTTNVRVPENQVGPIKLPLGPQPGLAQIASPGTVNNVSANGGDANTPAVANGPVASFLNEATEPSAQKAVAELFRTGAPRGSEPEHKVEDGDRPRPGFPQSAGARVGFAGFRNDASGMLVMVDVGGLEPGNYSVSIADASAIRNQTETSRQTPNSPEPTNPAGDRGVNPQGSGTGANPGGLVPDSNKAPLEAPATGGPQSQLEHPAMEIPRAVLAQVSASSSIEGAIPPNGRAPSAAAPVTGQVNPDAARTADSKLRESQVGGVNPNSSTARPIQNPLGTLTVDQSGTGRMQHVVEGLRVSNVIGQALVIYMSNSPTTTLPANLDATTDPSSVKKSTVADPANSSDAATNSAGSQNRAAPVVGGIIHLLSDRGAGSPDNPAATSATRNQPQ